MKVEILKIHPDAVLPQYESSGAAGFDFITIENILAKYPASVLKILFLQTHYSHPVDFSWEKMEESKKAYERIDILMKKLKDIKEEIAPDKDIDGYRLRFEEVMDDDFNTAQALGVIFELVSFINKNIEDGKKAGYAKKVLVDLGKTLGLFEGPTMYYGGEFNENTALAEKVNLLIKNRNEARKKKDFKAADRIRKELEEQGVILEDTKDTTTWRTK